MSKKKSSKKQQAEDVRQAAEQATVDDQEQAGTVIDKAEFEEQQLAEAAAKAAAKAEDEEAAGLPETGDGSDAELAEASDEESEGEEGEGSAPAKHKSRKVAMWLAILLGWVGAHKFYMGKVLPALFHIAFSVLGVFWGINYSDWSMFIWLGWVFPIFEGSRYMNMTDEEFDEVYIQGGRSWF